MRGTEAVNLVWSGRVAGIAGTLIFAGAQPLIGFLAYWQNVAGMLAKLLLACSQSCWHAINNGVGGSSFVVGMLTLC